MQSKYPTLEVTVDRNLNNDSHAPVVSSLDNEAREKESLTLKQSDKTKWCCFYIRLPVTGKLERKTLTWIAITVCIDALVNLCLFFATHQWWFLHQHPPNPVTWHVVHRGLQSFHSDTVDTLILWAVRLVILFTLTCIAISNGVPPDLWRQNEQKCCCLFACCKSKRGLKSTQHQTSNGQQYAVEGLVTDEQTMQDSHIALSSNIGIDDKSNKDKDAKKRKETEDGAEDIEGIEDRRRLKPKFENKDDAELYEKRKQKAVAIKYSILLLMFLLCTVFQGYIGVKCVTFEFRPNELPQAILFGICVICINVEIFLFKSFIESATDLGESIIVKSLHTHPLEERKKVKFWCNLCRSRAKYSTYRCESCNFDVCSACYKKEKNKLKSKQEERLKAEAAKTQDSMKYGGKLSKSIRLSAASESFKYKNASVGPGENDPTLALQKEMTSTRYLMRAISLCRPHATLILTAFTCLGINSAANLLLPRSQGHILDKIVNNDKQAFIYQVKYYLVLSVIVGFFGAIRSLCFTFTMRRLIVSVRSLMFNNIIVQDIQFFDDMSTGELISRMTNDVRGMMSPLKTMLQTTLSNLILLTGGFIMCFVTSWRLSMLAFTTVAPVLFLTGQYAKWSRNINRAIWAAFGSATQIASQAFSNIRTVRAFGTEAKEIRNYENALQEILERGLMNAIAETATFTLTNYLDLGAGVMILYFGGMTIFENQNSSATSRNELTIGKLITFQLYWNMINHAYQGLQNVLTSFTRGAGAAQRVLTMLDVISNKQHNLYSGLVATDKNGKQTGLDGNIFIENISFSYKTRADNPVLSNLSLCIQSGQVIALVGRSGGGKSTLIHLLMRFYDVTEGGIYYNEERLPLKEMNLTYLRQQIGFVAQDTQLFDCTIKENIVYGAVGQQGEEDEEPSMEEIEHYSKLANCHEFISKFEEGYATRVGERGVRLSGGQKQRIAIARMLMKKPKILFLDEATSNLDTESEALVQATIDRTIWYEKHKEEEKYEEDELGFRANAVVLVAHRLSTVINADKIAVIDQGNIVEFGNHDELLQIENGVYRKLVQRQIQREQNQLDQDADADAQQQAEDKEKKKGKQKKQKKKNVPTDDIDSLFAD